MRQRKHTTAGIAESTACTASCKNDLRNERPINQPLTVGDTLIIVPKFSFRV